MTWPSPRVRVAAARSPFAIPGPTPTYGIDLQAGNNTVGGTVAGARHIISGNGLGSPFDAGVVVESTTGDSGNLIEGSYIGIDASGTSPLGNHGAGVLIEFSGTTVGGTAAGAGNVISANTGDGVLLYSNKGYASGTVIAGNLIGTDATGRGAPGNSGSGVAVNATGANSVSGTADGSQHHCPQCRERRQRGPLRRHGRPSQSHLCQRGPRYRPRRQRGNAEQFGQ
jgi:hypothetical protein